MYPLSILLFSQKGMFTMHAYIEDASKWQLSLPSHEVVADIFAFQLSNLK